MSKQPSPTLTIGIPTYNRADFITDLLDCVLNQITDDLRGRINVFVSDNASTDDTQKVIESYSVRHPGLIQYQRQPTNIGFSPNVDQSIRNASGDFVLVMSDDDTLEPYALSDIIKTLDQHPSLGLLTLAWQSWTKDLKCPSQPFQGRLDRFFTSGSDFIQAEKNFTNALISGYVVNKKRWITSNPQRFFDINSIHLIMGLIIPASSPFALLRAKPYVRYREDMGHWSIETDPLYPFPLYVSYLKGCQAMTDIYSKHMQTILYCSALRTTIGHIIRNKVLNYPFPRKDIEALLSPYLDRQGLRRRLYTALLAFFLKVPRFLLYVPFRWLVPEKL